MKKPVLLLIMDGLGLRDETYGNAFKLANTPCLDNLMSSSPFVKGRASGTDVGLPKGQMGNSEVGHLNMGAGRIVYQELSRITNDIETGDFFKNDILLEAISNCKKNNSALHLFGLLSDGGVHSHISHLFALMRLARENGLSKVYIHCFMDGRDTPPDSGVKYISELEKAINDIGVGKIATISGRYYAMDRDNNYDRVKLAFDAMTKGKGVKASGPLSAIEDSYKKGIYDEFIVPTVIYEGDKPVATVNDRDSLIFFSFRPDRARELTRCFTMDELRDKDGNKPFDRGKRLDTFFVCFTEYDSTIPHTHIAFRDEEIVNTFGEYISKMGKKQLRIAETEKYAHVTFFFNGGREKPYEGEDRILVPSPKEVPTYDLKPEMSAYEVCDKLIDAILSRNYDAIICNFANPDMVGHTGVMEAAIKAIETVDKCLSKIVDAISKVDGVMFLCADHGNAEEMINSATGAPHTAHTTNPVPFILVGGEACMRLKEGGRLSDIAPTLLDLMGLSSPKEMTANSLLIRN